MRKIAVVGSEGITFEGGGFSDGVPQNINALARRVLIHEPAGSVVYVHANALPAMGLPPELPVPRPGERAPEHPFLTEHLGGFNVSHRSLAPSIRYGESVRVMIGAYQAGAGAPFADAEDEIELLAATIAFRDAFRSKALPGGWTFEGSAVQTGEGLMHRPWKFGTRRRRVEALHVANHELDGDGAQHEVPFGGKWAHEHDEPRGPYVKAWDVNGQRLAACARLPLGIGEPEHYGNGAPVDRRVAGYHLVTAVDHPHAGAIPPIFEPGWHSTPRVAMAAQLGLNPVVEESLIWPESVAYLDPFYVALRDARAMLLSAGAGDEAGNPPLASHQLALGAVKQCYLQALGRLRSDRARETQSMFYRPSWYDQIIGQELARQWLRLHQLAEAGEAVLAVYFDTIIIEDASADLYEAPDAIEVSVQLGKYKPVGVLDAAFARDQLYGVPPGEPDVGRLVRYLGGPTGQHDYPLERTRLELVHADPLGRPPHKGYPGQVVA